MSDPSGSTRADAISRGEVILFLLLLLAGVFIWALVDQRMSAQMAGEQPLAEQMLSASDVPNLQAQLAMIAAERKQTQDQLIAARLELAQQSAMVGAMETIYPRLTQLASTTAISPALDSANMQAYQDVRVKLLAATKLRDSLTARLAEIDTDEKQVTTKLQQAQRGAGHSYEQAHWSFQMKKSGMTFMLAGGLVAFGLLIILVVTARQGPKPRFPSHRGIIIGGAGLVLLVALAYQTFGMIGAVIAGLVALLIALPRLSWPDRPA